MIFAEVVRRQSFTAAARHLKMSKAAVSQHVSRLETEIGGSLLKRHTRGMSLTAIGERLYDRAETLGGHVDAALAEIAGKGQEAVGEFSITAPHALEAPVLVPAVRQLAIEFPGLRPRLIVTDSVLDLIHDDIDMSLYLGALKDSSYKAQRLGEIVEVFCASPQYLRQYGHPNSLEDLKRHRWISIDWQSTTFHGESAFLSDTRATLEPFYQCNNLTGALEMAQNDMGVVLLPDIAALPLFRSGALQPLLVDIAAPSWPVHFLHPYKEKKPLHLERFQQLVRHYFWKAKSFGAPAGEL